MKKSWKYIIILVLLFLLIYLIFNLVKKDSNILDKSERIGGLDIETVTFDTRFSEEYFFVHVPYTNIKESEPVYQSKDNFTVLIRAGDIVGYSQDLEKIELGKKITIPDVELPFFNDKKISVIIPNLCPGNACEKIVEAIILSQDKWVGQSQDEDKFNDWYRLTIKLPDDIDVDPMVWEYIQNANFSITKFNDKPNLVVPKDFVLNNPKGDTFACLIIDKKESMSIDYQYYNLKTKIVPIKVGNKNELNNEYFNLSSGLKHNDEIAKSTISCTTDLRENYWFY